MYDKFKVIAFAIFALFIICLVGGFVYLEAAGRPTSTFIIFAASLVGNAVSFGGLAYTGAKQSQQIEVVRSQTNGTLSALREANDRLSRTLFEQHGISVTDDGNPVPASDPAQGGGKHLGE